uniref:Uncharacterized protein n=1 Tax=Arundo donax TaxID=35708 RepID=A0A0A9BUJ3_ARUDO
MAVALNHCLEKGYISLLVNLLISEPHHKGRSGD